MVAARSWRTRCSPQRAPRGGVRSVAEPVQRAWSSLPVLVDLHEELEIDALGQLLPHGDADLLQDLAALADYDPLLRLALDEDLAADARPFPLGDTTRDRVRQLFARHRQQLLADELGHPERLGDVGDHVV